VSFSALRVTRVLPILLTAVSLLSAAPSLSAAPGTSLSCAPIAPTPPSVSNVSPVSTALHFLPPLAHEGGDPQNLDRSLLDYLEVRPCDVNTTNCQALASLTSVAVKHEADGIDLKNKKYQVNWNIAKADRGKQAQIQIRVAGLLIDGIPHAINAPSTLPVQFRVDNHPRIRARVLHEQGQSAMEITDALLAEFHLSGFDLVLLLHDEDFISVDIAAAIKGALGATPDEITAWMRDAHIRAAEIARALFAVYGQSSNEVAGTLRGAGVTAADVFAALKATAPGWSIESGEGSLQSAGFCAADVFAAIQPDLAGRYEGWAKAFGPILYLDDAERYRNASTAWYMSNSYVHWVLPNGGCPATPDLKQGGPCNTATGAVTPEGLVGFIQQRFIHNASFLQGYGVDASDVAAVRSFVESLDIRVVQDDLSVPAAFGQAQGVRLEGQGAVSAGEPSLATSYVHVIRNKTPGTLEFGTTDLEFWFFYPYNGPGTVRSDIKVFGVSYHPQKELDPLGTHIPDWENVTLRIDNSSGQVVQITGSAHGDVRDLALPAGIAYDGAHPIVYSSRNGHSLWGVVGDNPLPLADYQKDLKIPFGLFDIDLGTFGIRMDGLNITSRGFRFDASSSFELMAVYDTCVDASDSTPGMCEASAPVQPPDAARDALHQVVPIGSCSYLDGSPVLRRYDVDGNGNPTHDTAALAPSGTTPALMAAICPRVFTAQADGSPMPNREWWLYPHFGPEKSSTLGLDAWEAWVNVDFGPAVFGAIALGCLPFTAVVGVGYEACVGIASAAFELALPFVKDQVINAFLPAPGSPSAPYWHPCSRSRNESC
jgi:hypothetical protein